ncbi:PKD domain-containing protein [bacterium]|nr:PKD domain-containing protein [bacterium]
MYKKFIKILVTLFFVVNLPSFAQKENKMVGEKDTREFKIFQFPRNQIPRIDGKTDDWDIVPPEYTYGMEHIKDIIKGKPNDPKVFDMNMTVGWVKGLNRLYFKYEAYDSYWDFGRVDSRTAKGYMNDLLEIVVDGARAGGNLISNPLIPNRVESYMNNAGSRAQNYHIFTPPVDGEWTIVWGCQPWIKEFPYANYAYSYDFKHGEPGKLIFEFYITVFDHASYDGPEYSIESKFEENKTIGLTWMVLDFKGEKVKGYDAFYSLTQVGHSGERPQPWCQASDALPFKLMPLEKQFRKPVEADWTFKVVDMANRKVAFLDRSYGNITSWKWYFGDGTTSTEQNPIHTYAKPGTTYVVLLEVSGPDGQDKKARYWDVMIK